MAHSQVTIDAMSAGESHSQPFRQASRTSATSLNTRFAKRFRFRYDILLQLWTVRRQKQESYVFGKLLTFMPAGTVENQNAVAFRLYGSEGEMFVHGFCDSPAWPTASLLSAHAAQKRWTYPSQVLSSSTTGQRRVSIQPCVFPSSRFLPTAWSF